MALEGDVLRAMYGSGLYLAGIGLFTVAVGFLLRHTAGTISIVLALMLILGNMVNLVPGEFGEWLTKLMPGNAGSAISTPVSFNPNLLDAVDRLRGVRRRDRRAAAAAPGWWCAGATPDPRRAGRLSAPPRRVRPWRSTCTAHRGPTSSPTPSASCWRRRSTTRSPRRSWWCRPRAWSAG